MPLSISNIAWDSRLDTQVAELLNRYDVKHIDVAPGKVLADPFTSTDKQVELVRRQWNDRGVEIFGMQSLLFGTQGMNVFADANVRGRMLHHLEIVCRLASLLGVGLLTFGSPRNRDRTGLDDLQVLQIATDFFGRLGDIAVRHGVIVCLEPNPERYGCNFLTKSAEVLAFVQALDHPGIRCQIDIGAMLMNDEEAGLLETMAPYAGHIHLSEPSLAILGSQGHRHDEYAKRIDQHLPGRVRTIEMLTSGSDAQVVESIDAALGFAVATYTRGEEGAT